MTFPLYLYGALRFPSRLPEVLAVAVVVMTVSLLVVIGAEIGRRIAERRLGSLTGYAGQGANSWGQTLAVCDTAGSEVTRRALWRAVRARRRGWRT